MWKVWKCCCLLFVAVCLLVAQSMAAEEGVKGNLVSVNWLEKNLKSTDVVILDGSPAQVYTANHIPGAVAVDLYNLALQEKPIPELEKLYQSWGISSGKKVVMYDQGGTFMATRIFFSLYYAGFPAENLFVLDGGMSKWQEKGLPVTKDATLVPKTGSFRIAKFNEDARARLPEVLNASGDPINSVLVEALGPDWHFGEVLAFNKAGHIPNGVLLPSSDFFNPDKTFKSAEEIKKMVTYVGIRPEQQIYSYCGGGVSASAPFFALKFILKYPKVKLYQESEMGWLSDERDLPYWTYDAPFLMRETNWLRSWSSPRFRMMGLNHVSIIDVRPPELYNQGHVPFALNIPAGVFKTNINNPEKLAKLLGPAGVDQSHEAVVLTGAGLTTDSALAFLMLEKVGQKKVSIFMDSMDAWAKLAHDVAKDATVVGPRKGPGDLSVPPTNYPETPRNSVVIADAKSSQGVYPKVFIASGKEIPAKVQNGKVVHVPYMNLVNPDGTPKPAKDIWNILDKAGVPRYAELVCFSDDPGEAAANYYILKLMGYPDIKVLVL